LAVDAALATPSDALPPTLNGRQTALIFGCSYWSLLEQVKRGDCPVEPLRLGRNLRWPTTRVLAAVGIERDGLGG
jgi:hypothetical protein